jgi:hypothetical protein
MSDPTALLRQTRFRRPDAFHPLRTSVLNYRSCVLIGQPVPARLTGAPHQGAVTAEDPAQRARLSPNQLDRQRQIVEAAELVPARDGVAGCTARAVADASPLTKSAILTASPTWMS